MNRRNQKAITLIALVVTIVVLLILAGVSIAMLTGENGIITQAQNSKNKNEQGEIEEQVKLAIMAAKTAGLGEIDIPTLNSELKNIGCNKEISKLPAIIEINGKEIEIEDEGTIKEVGPLPEYAGNTYETETEVTIGNEKVIVPGGATISGIRGECEDVDDGVVIYIISEGEEVTDWNADSDENGIIDVQEKYDQFVWVPVPNAIAVDKNADNIIDETDIDLMIADEEYPMAIATDSTNYRGVLYDFTESTDDDRNVSVTVADKDYTSTSNYLEPSYLTDGSWADASSYNTVGITKSSLQTEFNTMVEKVSNNKGFWIGRYETSNIMGTASTSYNDASNKATVEADTTNKVTVIKGTTTGIGKDNTVPNYVNWYRMYAQQKNYSNHASITSTSSMIWGSQWDQTMIWMKEVKNTSQNSYYVVNSLGMGNFGLNADGTTKTTKAIEPTGNSENYKVKNVYDLAGNVNDWTLEGNGKTGRDIRRESL